MTKFVKDITKRNLVDAKKAVKTTLYGKVAEKLATKRVEIAKTFRKDS